MKYLALLTLPFLAVACMQQPELDNDDGPQANSTEIQKALGDAWGDVDPSSINQREYTYSEVSQRVQGIPAYDPARVLFLEGLTVLQRDVKETEIDYKIVQEVSDRTGTEAKTSSTEYQVTVPRVDLLSVKQFNPLKEFSASELKPMSVTFGVQIVFALAQACTKSETWDEDCKTIQADKCDLTCHNLKVTTDTVAAPLMVRSRANCEGLTNCQMRTTKVSFDQIVSIKKGDSTEKNKVSYSATISPDVPYLSRLMSQCTRRLLTVSASNQKVLGEVCNDVKNFEFGER